MSRTRTLTDLIADVRNLADIEGATLRHTDAKVTREINQSIQRFREWVTEEGFPLYLTAYTVNLTIGATSPFVWREVNLSALNAAHIKAVECYKNGQAYDLDKIPFENRNKYAQQNAQPVAWFQRGSVIGVLPPPQAADPITVWYLPTFTDLAAGTETFDGLTGWEEWVRWNSIIALYTRDQYPALIDNAVARCEQIKAEFKTKLREDRPSGALRRDVRNNREFGRSRVHYYGMGGGGGVAGGPGVFDATFDWSFE